MQTVMAAEDTSARKASKPRAKQTVSKAPETNTASKPDSQRKGPWVSPDGERHWNRKRPSIYDDGMLKRVCDGLVEGLSIKQACTPDDMPRWQEIYLEMQRDEGVRSAIAHAREAQQEVTADDIVEMADLATPEDHNVVKLRIWARQWRAAKLAPKKYGEKQSVEVTADIGATAARVLMDLTQQAREAKAIIDVTPNRDPSLVKGVTVIDNARGSGLLPKDSED